jgi:hypothetical protein
MALVGVNVKDAAAAVGGVLSGVGDFAIKLRSAITGKISPQAEAELLQKASEIELAAQQAQTKINEVEAASPKLFIAGARPAVLWVCVLVLFYTYIVNPILKACGVALPDMSIAELWPLMTGLLGLGGMRTYEKVRGVAGSH